MPHAGADSEVWSTTTLAIDRYPGRRTYRERPFIYAPGVSSKPRAKEKRAIAGIPSPPVGSWVPSAEHHRARACGEEKER